LSTKTQETRYADRILEQLVKLCAASASTPFARLESPDGIWRFTFRAGGWPVQVDIDSTVLEVRVYHGRQVIAMGRVTAPVFAALTGAEPLAKGSASADECIAALRAIVADWRRRNARVYMEPPRVARHPDGWNNA